MCRYLILLCNTCMHLIQVLKAGNVYVLNRKYALNHQSLRYDQQCSPYMRVITTSYRYTLSQSNLCQQLFSTMINKKIYNFTSNLILPKKSYPKIVLLCYSRHQFLSNMCRTKPTWYYINLIKGLVCLSFPSSDCSVLFILYNFILYRILSCRRFSSIWSLCQSTIHCIEKAS